MDNAPAPLRPRRRRGELPWWVTVAVFAALAAAGGAGWYYATTPTSGVRVEEVKAAAERDLPPGTDRNRVQAWLAGWGVTDVSDLTDTGGKVDGLRGVLPNDTLFEPADIHFEFRFDRHWQLTRSDVFRTKRW